MTPFPRTDASALSGVDAPLREGRAAAVQGWRGPLLLLGVVGAVWGVSLGGGFRFDDLPNLVHDPATSEAGAFLDRLGWGLRPLLRGSYFLDHTLWGMNAIGFHVTNLLLHAGAVLALYHLALRRLGHEGAALVVALVFALQPAHAEAVAYLSGRSVLLSTALLMGALLAQERGREDEPSARVWRWTSHLAFVLAVLARETALVYPFLLLLWETSRPGGGDLRRLRVPLGFAMLLAALLLALPRYRELAAYSTDLRSPLAAMAMNLAALPEALSLWFRPWALSLVHPPPEAAVLPVALGGALVLFLAGLAILGRRQWPWAAFAAAWILIALAPTHGLIARRDSISERHLYLAWVGPSFLAGSLWMALRRASTLRMASFVGGLLLLGAGWTSQRRANLWRDEVRLWTDTVSKAPRSALAWNNLGAARRDAGDVPGAAAAFRHAIDLDPLDRKPRFNLLALEMTAFRALDTGSPK